MPPVIKWLLIVNFAVYMIGKLTYESLGQYFYEYGAVRPDSFVNGLQVWRLVTYQFLHDPSDIFHLVFNLLVLFFFGPILERQWGSRRFLKFYLAAGAAGGLVYTVLALAGILDVGPMVGASGAIYGVVAAIAVLYPRMKVLLWGLIPMTMVWLVILVVIVSLMKIAAGSNAGGEMAHLTGLAVGFLYVKYQPLMSHFRMERHKGAWAKKMEDQLRFQQEVDRILAKVHHEGIGSLTAREKQMLQEATRREQQAGR
jgi:membrane associated rhomboid family serine protease